MGGCTKMKKMEKSPRAAERLSRDTDPNSLASVRGILPRCHAALRLLIGTRLKRPLHLPFHLKLSLRNPPAEPNAAGLAPQPQIWKLSSEKPAE